MMNAKTEAKVVNFDRLKWLIVIVLVVAAVIGNHYFAAQSILYRALAVVAVATIAGIIAIQTTKGRTFVQMAKDARAEIRKVVWPTRQETSQTTMLVVGVVLIMALLLWGMDSFLGWLISFIVG